MSLEDFGLSMPSVPPVSKSGKRWFINIGQPGYNTSRNNGDGYSSEAAARRTIQHYTKKGEAAKFAAALAHRHENSLSRTITYHNTVTWKLGDRTTNTDGFATYDEAAVAVRKTLDTNPAAVSVAIAKHTTTIEPIGTFLK